MVHAPAKVDLAAAENAAAAFLTALGVGLDTESLRGTPGRMARAYAEMFRARPFDLTTFPNDEGYDELVVARSIPVQSGPRSRRVSADQGHQVVVHLEGDARNRRLVDMRGSTVDYLLEVRLALWLFRRSRSSSTMASRKSRSSPISSPSGRVSASFGGTSTAAGTGGQQEARTTKSLSHA